jgi:hypothetical protein
MDLQPNQSIGKLAGRLAALIEEPVTIESRPVLPSAPGGPLGTYWRVTAGGLQLGVGWTPRFAVLRAFEAVIAHICAVDAIHAAIEQRLN